MPYGPRRTRKTPSPASHGKKGVRRVNQATRDYPHISPTAPTSVRTVQARSQVPAYGPASGTQRLAALIDRANLALTRGPKPSEDSTDYASRLEKHANNVENAVATLERKYGKQALKGITLPATGPRGTPQGLRIGPAPLFGAPDQATTRKVKQARSVKQQKTLHAGRATAADLLDKAKEVRHPDEAAGIDVPVLGHVGPLGIATTLAPVAPGAGLVGKGVGAVGERLAPRVAAAVAERFAGRGAAAVAEHGGAAAVEKGGADVAETAAKTGTQKAGRALWGSAKVAAKTATYPIRRPIKFTKYSALAQAPVAATSGDPLSSGKDFLEGHGLVGTALGGAGAAVGRAVPGVAGNALEDLIDLPAQIVPSVYLPAAGGVEAAQGDSSRISKLWQDYLSTGIIPPIVQGRPGEAVSRLGEHPVFGALELSGVKAVAGRGIGAVARRAPGEAGSVERAPLEVAPGLAPKPRQFSPDIINKQIQKAMDRRRAKKYGVDQGAPRTSETEGVGAAKGTPIYRGAGGKNATAGGRVHGDTGTYYTNQREYAQHFGEVSEHTLKPGAKVKTIDGAGGTMAAEKTPYGQAVIKSEGEFSQAAKNRYAEKLRAQGYDALVIKNTKTGIPRSGATADDVIVLNDAAVGKAKAGSDLSLTRVTPARKGGALKGSERTQTHGINELIDRIVGQEEGVRRKHRGEEAKGALQSLKDVKLSPRTRKGRRSAIQREGISLAVKKIVRSPETFHQDLDHYSKILTDEHGRLVDDLAAAETKAAKHDIRNRIGQNQQTHDFIEQLNREGNPEQIFAAAEPNIAALRKIDEQLAEGGTAPREQLAQARLIPAARVHLGAEHGIANETRAQMDRLKKEYDATDNPQLRATLGGKLAALSQRKQLIDREGNALPVDKAEAQLRKAGVDPEQIGFVSEAPRARGARSFYKAMFPDRSGLARAGKKTGKATVEGTIDPTFDAVAEQRIKGRGIVDARNGYDRTMSEIAVGGKRYTDRLDADQAAARLSDETGQTFRSYRLVPKAAKEGEARRAEQILDSMDPSNHSGMESVVNQLLDDAVKDGPGSWVVVPEQAISRLREHFQAATTTRRVMQVVSSAFKGVVLPTSPNWMLGNTVDVNTRALLSGTGLYGRNQLLGRKLISEVEKINPEMAERLKAGVVPGGVYGAAEANKVFRDARQFQGTKIAGIARAMGTLRRAPGAKQVVNLYAKYRDGVFAVNQKFIEDQSNYALLGKAARREVRLTTGRWEKGLRLGDDAIRDLAKGLLDTPNQIRYAKQIEQTLGQWTANGPEMRAFLIDYAPFAMWARAATKFVLFTLPVHHPIKTALAAAAYEMTEKERDALGLSHFADKPLPSNLQGGIPIGGGGLLAPQSLSSFGYFADYQNSLSTSILPQLPLGELAGYDWTGKKLTHGDGTPLNALERVGAVLNLTAESYLPFLAMGNRARANGIVQGTVPRSLRPYDKGLTSYLRELSQMKEIPVPAHSSSSSSSSGGSSGSGAQWGSSSSGGSSSGGAQW